MPSITNDPIVSKLNGIMTDYIEMHTFACQMASELLSDEVCDHVLAIDYFESTAKKLGLLDDETGSAQDGETVETEQFVPVSMHMVPADGEPNQDSAPDRRLSSIIDTAIV